MVKRLCNKIALITGSSSGIGRAIALAYASEGATVVCTDVTQDVRPELPGLPGKLLIPTHEFIILKMLGKATFIKVDVLIEHEVAAAIENAVKIYGRLDIIVNNAGIADEIHAIAIKPGGNRIHESETEAFDLTMAVNTRGVYLGCKYAIRQFLKQEPHPENSRGDRTRGWIVNVASIAGMIALPGAPAYNASKHAVLGLTKEIAVSYAKDRIHCNALCPSFVPTALIADITYGAETPVAVAMRDAIISTHPWGTLGTPEDVARAAVFLASEDSQWMTGTSLVLDGGYTAQ